MVRDSNFSDEERITVETPLPQAVDPPPQDMTTPLSPPETTILPVATLMDNFPVATFVSNGTTRRAAAADGGGGSAGGDDDEEHTGLGSSSPSDRRMCTVVAPATLEAGFVFEATVDGIDFSVTVPEGGVVEGQRFQVPYPGPTTTTTRGTTPLLISGLTWCPLRNSLRCWVDSKSSLLS